MGADESGTHLRLKTHRSERIEPIIRRRRGRLIKLTGDGAMIEFASAVDALSAAVEIQQAMIDANRDQPTDTAIVLRIGLDFGDFIVDDNELYGDGVNIAVRLEAAAPAGGIVISANMRDAVAGRMKANFVDLGSLVLKNIDRPVGAFRVEWSAADWSGEAGKGTSPSIAAALAAPPALPDKPSIAVLPFTNMSADPEQEYFTDGITEDIITEMSRFHEIFVIARNSTFTYKGRSVDVRLVATELGVRYVLEGSIRKAADRVRVTGQLIDALSGSHIWAERYDRVLKDIFAVQEELTRSIVRAIAPHILDAETEKIHRRRPEDLNAYEIAVRASAKAWDAWFKSDSGLRDAAIADAAAALAIDPRSTTALTATARARPNRCWRARIFWFLGLSLPMADGWRITSRTRRTVLTSGLCRWTSPISIIPWRASPSRLCGRQLISDARDSLPTGIGSPTIRTSPGPTRSTCGPFRMGAEASGRFPAAADYMLSGPTMAASCSTRQRTTESWRWTTRWRAVHLCLAIGGCGRISNFSTQGQ